MQVFQIWKTFGTTYLLVVWKSSGSRLEVVWTSWKSSDKVVWTSCPFFFSYLFHRTWKLTIKLITFPSNIISINIRWRSKRYCPSRESLMGRECTQWGVGNRFLLRRSLISFSSINRDV
ncbi:hypothetical protein Bca101_036895 [Brassica carinata]